MNTTVVISDLHLGGLGPGSSICNSHKQLGQFIDWLATDGAGDGPLRLVLNGDIVDFLMESQAGLSPEPWTPDEGEVIRRLDAIVGAMPEPFQALRRFCDVTRGGQRSLVLLLGNHDVELSLPSVRRHLIENVLQADGARLTFVYDGEAFTDGPLLIEHGNRYDRFNVIDHSALRQERSVLSRGLPLVHSGRLTGRFKPPAGSVLVTELFNGLKHEGRFVDLLKPETEAVLPVLLTLNPELGKVLSALLTLLEVSGRALGSGLSTAAEPRRDGELRADTEVATLSGILSDVLRTDARLFRGTGGAGELGAAEVFDWLRDQVSKVESIANLAKIVLADGDESRRQRLAAALRALARDRSFDPGYELPNYRDAARALTLSGRFTVVVFGHTHLPKKICLGDPSPATYLNTGTWADIMAVPQEILGDGEGAAAALTEFLTCLAEDRLDGLVRRNLTYARIEQDDDGKVLSADLLSWRDGAEPVAAFPHNEPAVP